MKNVISQSALFLFVFLFSSETKGEECYDPHPAQNYRIVDHGLGRAAIQLEWDSRLPKIESLRCAFGDGSIIKYTLSDPDSHDQIHDSEGILYPSTGKYLLTSNFYPLQNTLVNVLTGPVLFPSSPCEGIFTEEGGVEKRGALDLLGFDESIGKGKWGLKLAEDYLPENVHPQD